MSRIFIIYLITGICFYASCTCRPQKMEVKQMKIEIEIIPESASGSYSVVWNDTLCSEFKSDWNYLQKRPYEIHCHVLDKEYDTIGYYQGLSTPQQFTYFQIDDCTDSIIYLRFSVGVNYFSEYIDSLNDSSIDSLVFKPIKFDIRTDIRKK